MARVGNEIAFELEITQALVQRAIEISYMHEVSGIDDTSARRDYGLELQR